MPDKNPDVNTNSKSKVLKPAVTTQPLPPHPAPSQPAPPPPPPGASFAPGVASQQFIPAPMSMNGMLGSPVMAGQQFPAILGADLGYLAQLDTVLIYENLNLLELVVNFEMNNRYTFCDKFNRQMFLAQELNDWATLNFLGRYRPFEMALINNQGQEIIHFSRQMPSGLCCYAGFCFCCAMCCLPKACRQSMDVFSPPGVLVSRVVQKSSMQCCPKFAILDGNGVEVLRLEMSPDMELSLDVMKLDGTKIGLIKKQYKGYFGEVLHDADTYGIKFPVDLDVHIKAALMGCAILVDYMYFEQGSAARNHHYHRYSW